MHISTHHKPYRRSKHRIHFPHTTTTRHNTISRRKSLYANLQKQHDPTASPINDMNLSSHGDLTPPHHLKSLFLAQLSPTLDITSESPQPIHHRQTLHRLDSHLRRLRSNSSSSAMLPLKDVILNNQINNKKRTSSTQTTVTTKPYNSNDVTSIITTSLTKCNQQLFLKKNQINHVCDHLASALKIPLYYPHQSTFPLNEFIQTTIHQFNRVINRHQFKSSPLHPNSTPLHPQTTQTSTHSAIITNCINNLNAHLKTYTEQQKAIQTLQTTLLRHLNQKYTRYYYDHHNAPSTPPSPPQNNTENTPNNALSDVFSQQLPRFTHAVQTYLHYNAITPQIKNTNHLISCSAQLQPGFESLLRKDDFYDNSIIQLTFLLKQQKSTLNHIEYLINQYNDPNHLEKTETVTLSQNLGIPKHSHPLTSSVLDTDAQKQLQGILSQFPSIKPLLAIADPQNHISTLKTFSTHRFLIDHLQTEVNHFSTLLQQLETIQNLISPSNNHATALMTTENNALSHVTDNVLDNYYHFLNMADITRHHLVNFYQRSSSLPTDLPPISLTHAFCINLDDFTASGTSLQALAPLQTMLNIKKVPVVFSMGSNSIFPDETTAAAYLSQQLNTRLGPEHIFLPYSPLLQFSQQIRNNEQIGVIGNIDLIKPHFPHIRHITDISNRTTSNDNDISYIIMLDDLRKDFHPPVFEKTFETLLSARERNSQLYDIPIGSYKASPSNNDENNALSLNETDEYLHLNEMILNNVSSSQILHEIDKNHQINQLLDNFGAKMTLLETSITPHSAGQYLNMVNRYNDNYKPMHTKVLLCNNQPHTLGKKIHFGALEFALTLSNMYSYATTEDLDVLATGHSTDIAFYTIKGKLLQQAQHLGAHHKTNVIISNIYNICGTVPEQCTKFNLGTDHDMVAVSVHPANSTNQAIDHSTMSLRDSVNTTLLKYNYPVDVVLDEINAAHNIIANDALFKM